MNALLQTAGQDAPAYRVGVERAMKAHQIALTAGLAII